MPPPVPQRHEPSAYSAVRMSTEESISPGMATTSEPV